MNGTHPVPHPHPRTMAVIVDYQNVHLTAAGLFTPDMPPEKALIHPVKFAAQCAAQCTADDTACTRPYRCTRIEVYRGLPNPQADRVAFHRNMAQRAQWLTDAQAAHVSTDITYRPLRYVYRTVDGRRVPDTSTVPPQEKGVDVLCALAVARLARTGQYDCVVLASRDSDLAPALDEAYTMGAKVMPAVWSSPDDMYSQRGFTSATFPHHTIHLGADQFHASVDTNPYDLTVLLPDNGGHTDTCPTGSTPAGTTIPTR